MSPGDASVVKTVERRESRMAIPASIALVAQAALAATLLCSLVSGSPAWRDVSAVEDTAIVGSNLWEVSVFAPEDLSAAGTGGGGYHGSGGHHGGGGGGHHGDQGFFKSKATKGDKGYKAFDSYHKKDGDSYGYEQHSAFGSAKGGKEAAAHQHATTYQEGDDHHGGHHRRRRQHEYGGHESAGGGGGEHHGYEHFGVGDHSSEHHGGGHHSEHHSSSGGGGGGHHGGGHHGFF
ncbi:uncharacterized protein [Hetaerina americana]|uniref:uncharacterized protein n=1 Tax=Hetaerina americana TaxID=62018 RepID=UPI003A7F4F53